MPSSTAETIQHFISTTDIFTDLDGIRNYKIYLGMNKTPETSSLDSTYENPSQSCSTLSSCPNPRDLDSASNDSNHIAPTPLRKNKSKLIGHTDGQSLFEGMSIISPAFTPVEKGLSPRVIGLDDKAVDGHLQEEVLRENHATLVSRSLMEDLPKVYCESRARIPTTNGTEIFLHLYRNDVDNKEHLAIVFGQDIHSTTLFAPREGETEQDRMTRGAYVGKLYPGRRSSRFDDSKVDVVEDSQIGSGEDAQTDAGDTQGELQSNIDTLVRIHSECYTGETAWSARCDCGEQLDEAARLMAEEKRGVIVYLRQEGRGIGLGEKLKAYNLQDLGADTVTANLMLRHPADARSFGLATAILLDLGLSNIRLLTNNPDKIDAVEGKDKQIKVTSRVPMIPLSWQNKGGFKSKEVNAYLKTKVERMGHLLNLSDSLS